MEDRRSQCPIVFALDIFGDRWTLLLVRDIGIYGKQYFGEFEGAGEGIATNILTDRLKLLQREGIVDKSRDPENGARRIYSLTDKGRDLLPIIAEMIRWSAKYDADSPVPTAFAKRLAEDREGVVGEWRAKSEGTD